MTKIEGGKDQLIRSSNLIVNASAPPISSQSNLKSVPPHQDESNNDGETPFEKAASGSNRLQRLDLESPNAIVVTPAKKDSSI